MFFEIDIVGMLVDYVIFSAVVCVGFKNLASSLHVLSPHFPSDPFFQGWLGKNGGKMLFDKKRREEKTHLTSLILFPFKNRDWQAKMSQKELDIGRKKLAVLTSPILFSLFLNFFVESLISLDVYQESV